MRAPADGQGLAWRPGSAAAAHPSLVWSRIVRQIRSRGLQAVEAQEQGTATMEVELSHETSGGHLTRDGLRLQPGPNCQLAVHGPTHTLTLSRLQRQDGGQWPPGGGRKGHTPSAHLVVTGGCS